MIGVLVFPDFQLLDASGPISVFEIAARYANPDHKMADQRIKVLSAKPGLVRSSSGVELLARGFRPYGAIDTLIVAGGEGVMRAAKCDKTIAFVRAIARRGVRIASVCSGAYILAEAGLLDGRRATTHWARTRHFLSAYPQVKLEPDRIFTRDGQIWTSAGISAGIDLALAMAAEDFGDEVAQKTARQLVLYHRRSGGQSQFSSLLELKAPSGRFGALLNWAREHLDAPLTVEDLAERAGMSSRQLYPGLYRGDGQHAVEGGGALAHRGGTPARAVFQRGDRAGCGNDRLPRSGADAPRLHPRLRPAAAIDAPRGESGLISSDRQFDLSREPTSGTPSIVKVRQSEFSRSPLMGRRGHTKINLSNSSAATRGSATRSFMLRLLGLLKAFASAENTTIVKRGSVSMKRKSRLLITAVLAVSRHYGRLGAGQVLAAIARRNRVLRFQGIRRLGGGFLRPHRRGAQGDRR